MPLSTRSKESRKGYVSKIDRAKCWCGKPMMRWRSAQRLFIVTFGLHNSTRTNARASCSPANSRPSPRISHGSMSMLYSKSTETLDTWFFNAALPLKSFELDHYSQRVRLRGGSQGGNQGVTYLCGNLRAVLKLSARDQCPCPLRFLHPLQHVPQLGHF